MADITAAKVKELRDRTDVPMMKCKEALIACDGDMDAAIEHLRKTAGAASDKRSGREIKAGSPAVALGDGAAAAVLLGCETDFVGGNEGFQAAAKALAELALAAGAETVEALETLQIDGKTVPEFVSALVLKLGENIRIAQVVLVRAEVIAAYRHGHRLVSLVGGSGDPAALRTVAMHVAAAAPAPIAIDRDGVPADLLAKERDIIAAQPDVQSKPEAIRPKIVEGKLGRFFKEHVLLEQEMLVEAEPGQSVADFATAKGLSVTTFARLGL